MRDRLVVLLCPPYQLHAEAVVARALQQMQEVSVLGLTSVAAGARGYLTRNKRL